MPVSRPTKTLCLTMALQILLRTREVAKQQVPALSFEVWLFGIDVISFLGNTQNPCNPSDHSEAVGSIGSCSSASLNSVDKFGNEFIVREEYTCEFESILGL